MNESTSHGQGSEKMASEPTGNVGKHRDDPIPADPTTTTTDPNLAGGKVKGDGDDDEEV